MFLIPGRDIHPNIFFMGENVREVFESSKVKIPDGYKLGLSRSLGHEACGIRCERHFLHAFRPGVYRFHTRYDYIALRSPIFFYSRQYRSECLHAPGVIFLCHFGFREEYCFVPQSALDIPCALSMIGHSCSLFTYLGEAFFLLIRQPRTRDQRPKTKLSCSVLGPSARG